MFAQLIRYFSRLGISTLFFLSLGKTGKAEMQDFQGTNTANYHHESLSHGNLYLAKLAVSSNLRLFSPEVCNLPAPTINSPKNSMQVNTLVPDFLWNGTGTTRYHLQIAIDDTFSNKIYDTTWGGLVGESISLALSFNLDANSVYYWRVSSVCRDYSMGAYSETADFSTADLVGPFIDPPAMIAPVDGEVVPGLKVIFSWENAQGATGWQLRLYETLNDVQNDWPFSWVWSDNWDTSTDWIFDTVGTYYWRFKVRDNVAWGTLSPTRLMFVGIYPFRIYLPISVK